MVFGFLQKLSLSSLVAPVAVEEFRARYWERQPLVEAKEMLHDLAPRG